MGESELEQLRIRAAELKLRIEQNVEIEGQTIPYLVGEESCWDEYSEACENLDEVRDVIDQYERMEHDPLDDVVYDPPEPEFEELRPIAKSRGVAIGKNSGPGPRYFVKHRGFGTTIDCEDLDHVRRCIEDFEAGVGEVLEPGGGTSLWEMFGLLGYGAKRVDPEE